MQFLVTSLKQIINALYSQGSPLKLSAIRYSNLSSRKLFPLVAGLLTEIPEVDFKDILLTIRLSTSIYGKEMCHFLHDSRYFLSRFWAWFYSYCPNLIRQFSCSVTNAERKILADMVAIVKGSLNDVLFFNLKNKDMYQPCWVVMRQPGVQRLVIIARGTLSLLDGFTDIDASSEPLSNCFPELTSAPNFYVHRGVLQATIWMYDSIVPCLHAWIDSELASSRAAKQSPETDTAGFSLLLSGHSLGSAVTVLLGALLLLKHPDRWTTRNIQCIGYGCPPISNAAFSDWTKDWLTMFIYDMDIVPRLGDHSLRVRARRAATYKRNIETLESANSISRTLMMSNSLILSGNVYLIQPTSGYRRYGFCMPKPIYSASSIIGETSLSSLTKVLDASDVYSDAYYHSPHNGIVKEFENRLYFVTPIDPHDFSETMLSEAALYDHLCYSSIIPHMFDRRSDPPL
ncbi:Lipase [Giardia duodenalis]|uniref:sn-1-specific diacylglycerol lipase n=1 Tax=Giardia intestinalis TaxID=5741 RepID=V6TKD9_GIAIN|nr:Lipase [Giardia intestinalis]